jgi:RimJ/RimL family protein N-acetyltransferase
MRATVIETPRLRLEPLALEHAKELARALDDPRLHEFIGGRPATVAELEARYARLVAEPGSARGEGWLNWIVRHRAADRAIGTVQATLKLHEEEAVAELAWVISTHNQRQGHAKEAVGAVAAWLRGRSVAVFVAHIHPGHRASMAVARSVGLAPTHLGVDGETRWRSPDGPGDAPAAAGA